MNTKKGIVKKEIQTVLYTQRTISLFRCSSPAWFLMSKVSKPDLTFQKTLLWRYLYMGWRETDRLTEGKSGGGRDVE